MLPEAALRAAQGKQVPDSAPHEMVNKPHPKAPSLLKSDQKPTDVGETSVKLLHLAPDPLPLSIPPAETSGDTDALLSPPGKDEPDQQPRKDDPDRDTWLRF